MYGILRAAAAVPHLALGNVDRNVQAHLEMIAEAKERHAALVVFPELSLTGASCGDLFAQKPLTDKVADGLKRIVSEMPDGVTAVVGAPIPWRGKLYNCAVVLRRDEFLGAVTKMYIPQSQKRHFRSGAELDPEKTYMVDDALCIENDLHFRGADGGSFAVTFADDLMAPVSPAARYAMAGAETIVCLSAGATLVNSRERIRAKVRQFSADCLCGCLLVQAGTGESTADALCGGYSAAAVCGEWKRILQPILSSPDSVTNVQPYFSSSRHALPYSAIRLFDSTMSVNSSDCSPDAFTKPSNIDRAASTSTVFAPHAHPICRSRKVFGNAMPRLTSCSEILPS
jgi:NAD+ synthase (glutamine-hydrolysing)